MACKLDILFRAVIAPYERIVVITQFNGSADLLSVHPNIQREFFLDIKADFAGLVSATSSISMVAAELKNPRVDFRYTQSLQESQTLCQILREGIQAIALNHGWHSHTEGNELILFSPADQSNSALDRDMAARATSTPRPVLSG